VQDYVDIFEQPRAHHEDLARAAFFGGRAVIAQCARDVIRLHIFLHGHRSKSRPGSEQVVPAPVTRRVRNNGLTLRERLLRESGQRVELTQDSNNRLAMPIAGDKGSGLAGHAGFHREACPFELALEQRGTLVFVIAELGIIPELFGDLLEVRSILVDELRDLLVCIGYRLCMQKRSNRLRSRESFSLIGYEDT